MMNQAERCRLLESHHLPSPPPPLSPFHRHPLNTPVATLPAHLAIHPAPRHAAHSGDAQKRASLISIKLRPMNIELSHTHTHSTHRAHAAKCAAQAENSF